MHEPSATDEKSCNKLQEDEIVRNKSGQLQWATLLALLKMLTPYDDVERDEQFISTFYTTFRCFVTPKQLVLALVARFRVLALYHQTSGCVKVVGVFTRWLKAYWNPDTDNGCLVLILEFNNADLRPLLPDRAEELSQNILRLMSFQSASSIRNLLEKCSCHVLRAKSLFTLLKLCRPKEPANDLFALKPKEVAQALSVKSMTIFCSIQPLELLSLASDENLHRVLNIKALTTLSNAISKLVLSTLAHPQSSFSRPSAAVHAVEFWIRVAFYLLKKHNNFETAIAITSALVTTTFRSSSSSSSSVSKNSTSHLLTQQTWKLVSTRYREQYTGLLGVLGPYRGYTVLRRAMKSALLPALPVLAVYLTDLIFIDTGQASVKIRPGLHGSVTLVNYGKFANMTECVREVGRHQVPYRFKSRPEVRKLVDRCIENVMAMDVEELGRKERVLEKSFD